MADDPKASDGRSYRCKGPNCDHTRASVNHWFCIWLSQGRLNLEGFDEALIDGLVAAGIQPLWACGQACSQRLVERFLNSGTL